MNQQREYSELYLMKYSLDIPPQFSELTLKKCTTIGLLGKFILLLQFTETCICIATYNPSLKLKLKQFK